MPELPQSTQAASKIKSYLEIAVFNARAPPVDPGTFQDQILIKTMPELPSRSRQLPLSNPYVKIAVFNVRAPPVDPGSFQDQTLMEK